MRACVYVCQSSHSIVLCEGVIVVVRITTLSPHSIFVPGRTHFQRNKKKKRLEVRVDVENVG